MAMKDRFARALPLVLAHEGGFTRNPKDPGNWTGGKVGVGVLKGTKYGIAANTFPHLDIENLRVEDVGPIYRRNYWDAVKGDQLPAGVSYAVFDFAVNSGPRRAIMALQRAVGVADDGKIGPVTLAAIARRSPEDTITRICADRLAFMRRLSTWPTFGRGWLRRVEGVEREAIRMALAAAPIAPREPDLVPVEPAPAPSLSLWQRIRAWFGF